MQTLANIGIVLLSLCSYVGSYYLGFLVACKLVSIYPFRFSPKYERAIDLIMILIGLLAIPGTLIAGFLGYTQILSWAEVLLVNAVIYTIASWHAYNFLFRR